MPCHSTSIRAPPSRLSVPFLSSSAPISILRIGYPRLELYLSFIFILSNPSPSATSAIHSPGSGFHQSIHPSRQRQSPRSISHPLSIIESSFSKATTPPPFDGDSPSHATRRTTKNANRSTRDGTYMKCPSRSTPYAP